MLIKKIYIYTNLTVINKFNILLIQNNLTNKFLYINKIKSVNININNNNNVQFFVLSIINKKYKSQLYLIISLLKKTMQDLLIGFYKNKLIMKGMGYRFRKENNKLFFKLGLSHEIVVLIPENIYIKVIDIRSFEIYSSTLKDYKNFLSLIRSYKFPDIYKGKGFLYEFEKIKLKKGKKSVY